MKFKSFSKDCQCIVVSDNIIIMRNSLEKIYIEEKIRGPFPKYGEYYNGKFYTLTEVEHANTKYNYSVINEEERFDIVNSEYQIKNIMKNLQFPETYEIVETGEKIRVPSIYQSHKLENIFLDKKEHKIKLSFNQRFKKWEANI